LGKCEPKLLLKGDIEKRCIIDDKRLRQISDIAGDHGIFEIATHDDLEK
jgi:hypothetical protein